MPNFHSGEKRSAGDDGARKLCAHPRQCGCTSDQMLDHIIPATAAMVPATPAITQDCVRHDS